MLQPLPDVFGGALGTPLQLDAGDPDDKADAQQLASRGISTAETALPHHDSLAAAFGPEHDLNGIHAHVGGEAEASAKAMGAEAFATGAHVVLPHNPSLGLVAHEVTHTLQQRAGVQLSGGVGEAGDPHELQADDIAERVERGERVGHLLPTLSAGATAGIQRRGRPGAGAPANGPSIAFLTSLRAELIVTEPRPLIVSPSGGTASIRTLASPLPLPADATRTRVNAMLRDGKGAQVATSAGTWRPSSSVSEAISIAVPGRGTYSLRIVVAIPDVGERTIETSITAQTDRTENLKAQSDNEVSRQTSDLQAQLAVETDPSQRKRLETAYRRTEWEASQRDLARPGPSDQAKGLPPCARVVVA